MAVFTAPFADVVVETVQTDTDSMSVEVTVMVSPDAEVEKENVFPGSVSV